MLFEIKIAIVILASIIAAYTDYRTGYIYDWLNYPFIVLGAILAFFSPNVIWAFGQAAIVFGIGYLFYRFGKLGGGDIKFFTGLVLYFPFFNNTPFILVVLILASLFAILFYGVYYLILFLRKRDKLVNRNLLVSLFFSIIFAVLFLIFSYWYLAVILFLLSFFCFFFILSKDLLMERIYRKEILASKLLDDDLIDMKFLSTKYKELKKISVLETFPLDKKSFNKIKGIIKNNEKVFVYRNLPIFGPFISLGIIAGFVILSIIHLF